MNSHCPVQQKGSMELTSRVEQTDPQGSRARSLRALFDSQEVPLLRYAYSLTGRRVVAEEIVQDVFLQLHKQWDEVNAPRAWLFRSVRNRAFNHVRDHQREVFQQEQPHIQTKETDSDAESVEALMMRMETIGKLRLILQELNAKDRELVMLKYFQNLKYREISERTGLSVSNVGYRLHHILKELGAKLRPNGVDEQS